MSKENDDITRTVDAYREVAKIDEAAPAEDIAKTDAMVERAKKKEADGK